MPRSLEQVLQCHDASDDDDDGNDAKESWSFCKDPSLCISSPFIPSLPFWPLVVEVFCREKKYFLCKSRVIMGIDEWSSRREAIIAMEKKSRSWAKRKYLKKKRKGEKGWIKLELSPESNVVCLSSGPGVGGDGDMLLCWKVLLGMWHICGGWVSDLFYGYDPEIVGWLRYGSTLWMEPTDRPTAISDWFE